MKGYGQFCPVAKAAEVFAERWTPLVLRELVCGSRRFSDLHRGVPLMSPTLLSKRLKELEEVGVNVMDSVFYTDIQLRWMPPVLGDRIQLQQVLLGEPLDLAVRDALAVADHTPQVALGR